MQIRSHFLAAVTDYLFLLEKDYPQKSMLKIVGNRYQLSGVERSMLYRGIIKRKDCEKRQQKLLDELPPASSLQIDGFNVIRTIGSYLLGKTLFIAMDGFLRDASEMHRSTLRKPILDKTVVLLFEFMKVKKVKEYLILLDSPISKSGEFANLLNQMSDEYQINGFAKTVHSPDYILKQSDTGIICSADSSIIDSSNLKFFDLARAILKFNYHPELLDFKVLLI